MLTMWQGLDEGERNAYFYAIQCIEREEMKRSTEFKFGGGLNWLC